MRPSPGVTVLQYFWMSSAQALSSLATLAVSFSRIVFPRSVCAELEPTDKMDSKGNNPSLASDFTVNFIRTSSDDWLRTAQLRSRRGVAMEARDVSCTILIGPRKA